MTSTTPLEAEQVQSAAVEAVTHRELLVSEYLDGLVLGHPGAF
jgi:hypothetical protein